MQLGELALVYTNIADEAVSASEAANMIIAQMKAFKIEAKDAIHILDAINETSNKFAVSSADIANSLGIASSVMANAGNSMEQYIALLTAGTEITRNSNKTANGLKSIALRLSGMNDEGEESLELTAKMEEMFNKLGKTMYDTNGDFKSTYDLLGELAEVFPTLTKEEKAFVAETVAGKYQANILTSILSNWTTAVEANETAINSQGSALNENEKVLDSIEGKINAFKSAFQELSKDLISSDLVKGVVDFGTTLLKVANSDFAQFTVKTVALFGALKAGMVILPTLTQHMKSLGTSIVGGVKNFNDLVKSTKSFTNATQVLSNRTKLLDLSQKVENQTLKETKAQMLAVGLSVDGVNTKKKAQIAINNALQASQLALNAVMAVGTIAITLAISAWQKHRQATEEARQSSIEAAQELTEWNESLKDEIKSIKEYRETLSNSASSTEDVTAAKKALIDIQDKLVERYGSEAKSIDLVNGKIDEQIAKIDELQRKEAQDYINKNQKSYNKDKEYLESTKESYETMYGSGSWKQASFYRDFADTKGLQHNTKEDAEQVGYSKTSVYGKPEELLAYWNDMATYLRENKDELKKVYSLTDEQIKEMQEDASSNIAKWEKRTADARKNVNEFEQKAIEAANGYNEFITEATKMGESGNLNAEAVNELLSKYPQLKQAFDDAGISAEDLAEKYNNSASALSEVAEANNNAESILTNYSSTLDGIQKQYETLTSAVDEYNEAGFLSSETLKKIMDNGLLEYLSYENGHLVANTEALYNKAEAQRIASSQELANAMTADILKVAENDVENASELAKSAVANLGNSAETAGNKAANATGQFISFATAVDQANKALEGKEITSDIQNKINAVKSAYKPAFDLLSQPIKINKKTYTSPSKKSSSSSSKSQKEWWEKELEALKDQFNYNEITIEEYISSLTGLLGKVERGTEAWRKINDELQKQRLNKIKDDYKEGRTTIEEYIKSLEDLRNSYKAGTEAYKDLTDAINSAKLDKIKDDYKAGRISLDEYIKSLKTLLGQYKANTKAYKELAELIKSGLQEQAKNTKDSYDDAKSAIDKVIDDEIEKLEKELDLLKEKNDEQERDIELTRLKDALENAKKNKSKRVWNGSEWIWMASQDDIDSAQKALDDFLKAEEEAAKSEAIQKQIDDLNDLKNQYSDVTKIYDQEQQKQQLIAMLGANAEADILNQRIDTLNKFKDKYIAIQREMASIDKMTPEQAAGTVQGNPTPTPTTNVSSASTTSTSSSSSSNNGLSEADIDRLAREVIRGKYGNGQARKNALGSNYSVVQNRVNKMLRGYSSGGIVDYTGLAMLHGSPNKPEMVLNYDQIKKFMGMLSRPETKSNITNTGQSIIYNFSGDFNLPNVNNAQQFLRDLKASVNIHRHNI